MTMPYGLLDHGPSGPQDQQALMGAPQPQPPAAPPQQPSLWQRLKAGAPDLLKSIQDRAFPVPTGLQGLLSPDDVQSARHRGALDFGLSLLAQSGPHNGQPGTGLLPAIGNAGKDAQAGFEGGIQNAMGAMTAGLGTAQQLRILQARDQIGKQFPPVANEQPAQTIDRLRKMYAAYVGAGDTEMASKIGDVVGKLGEDPRFLMMKNYKEPIRVTNGDHEDLYNPYDPTQKIGSVPHSPAPITPAEKARFDREDVNQLFTKEQGLQKDFTEETKNYRDVAQAYGNLKSLSDASLRGDPKAQLGVLESYMKMVNPGASIRPGVIQVASAASGLSDKFAHAYNDILAHGAKGNAEMRFYLNDAEKVLKSQRDQYQKVETQTRSRADRWGVDPSHVVNDPFAGITTSTAPSSARIRQFVPNP